MAVVPGLSMACSGALGCSDREGQHGPHILCTSEAVGWSTGTWPRNWSTCGGQFWCLSSIPTIMCKCPGPQACPCAKLRCSSLGGSLGCCRLWGPCSLYPIPELHSPTSKKDSSCPVVSGALGLAPSPASPHLHLCSLSLCTLGVCGPLWGEVLSAWVSAPAPDFQGGLWTPLVSEAEE